MNKIDTIVFDLGGVLIDWNPRYLYRKIFKTEDEITWFLENICTSEWNDKQDAGRSFEEATEELINRHPEWELPIRAWYGRWKETVGGQIPDTVSLLRKLREASQHRLFALTNWSAQTFPWAQENFEFLKWFDGIVVSGVERVCKPHPDIYRILVERYAIDPTVTLFIDDNTRNVEGGKNAGFDAVHFQSPTQIEGELKNRGVIQ